MRALVLHELGPDFGGCELREVPVPSPAPGEVLIRVRAAAVNFPDILQTRGEYQHKPPLPAILGMEVAGDVAAVGDGVASLKLGDAVAGAPASGGFADYAVARESSVRPKPDALSYAQAAGFGAAYLTAYVALVRRARLAPGEWVLVHGAAGGVGAACVDLAKTLGARVIAASASEAKLAALQDAYAPDALLNSRAGFRQQVKEITGGAGADIICDPVGGDVFDESTRCIAFDGRLLVIGFTSGRIATVSTNLPLIKGFSVLGVRAGEYGRRFPARAREDNETIWKLAEDGKVRPHVFREWPLEMWRSAFDSLTSRQVFGKAVVRPDI